jgi:hypothetical protein
MAIRRSRRQTPLLNGLAGLGFLLIPLGAAARAAEKYVGPAGTAQGAGTVELPWDIESSLLGQRDVKPGDTIYLLGGAYRRRPQEQFEVRLVGEAGKPIHVRPAPGRRATVDGGLLVLDPAAHVWVWDLEVLVSEPQPEKPVGPGSHPEDFKRPWGGLNIHGGRHCKYINLVIHDCRQGVSFWKDALDSELHGCLIYDNGWPATDRGHGHAVYTQNDQGTKTISDNIMTGGHSYSVHAYGSERAFVNNYLIEGNIAYAAGPFLVGGGRPSSGIRVLNNLLHGVRMQIGYDAPHNEDCEVRDNLIVNGGLSVHNYKRVVNEGNLLLGENDARPAGARVVLRPNKYDRDRANLAVFNWEKKPAVEVDFSAFLRTGDEFRLMNPRDFFGEPVVTGRYEGKPVEVPVREEFGAFVVLRKGQAS